MPARDAARYIGEAIESLLGQTEPPAELIVVDDGSTDATPEIARAYGHPVRVVSQGPLGPAAALNRGVEEATGELIAFCDADDICTPDRLERQVAAMLQHPECGIVSGFVQQFASPDVLEMTRDSRIDTTPTEAALNGLLMVRSEVFRSVGLFDESYATAVGVDWMGRVRSMGVQVHTVESVLLLRRVHDDNLGVREREQKLRDLTRVLRAHRQRAHRTDPD